ncbi:MAG: lipid A-modifier LpxR family protein, partial [Burkholderiaceae bacterium]
MTMPNTINKKTLALAGLLTATTLAHGEMLSGMADDWRAARRDGKTEIQVDIDNDSLLLRNLDGFYTSGVRLTVGAMRHRDDALATAGWRIGQDLYTPSDIKLPPELVGPPDHPYAGWLYGGVFHRIDRRDGFHRLIGLDLGCLGPCAAG